MVVPLFDQNPTQQKPVVTRLLIWANIIIFLMSWWLETKGINWIPSGYGMVPARLTADLPGELPKLFTSMFLHADWTHLGLNLLYLHIFGDNVEDALGRGRYLFFYLLSGVAAAGAQYLMAPNSAIPMIGASGAIAGVLGAYMVLYPRAPVVVFNPFIIPLPILPFPSWLVIGWWFFLNVMRHMVSGGAGGVAYLAHIGGFLMGLFFTRSFVTEANRRDLPHTGSDMGQEMFSRTTTTRTVKRPIFRKNDAPPFWR